MNKKIMAVVMFLFALTMPIKSKNNMELTNREKDLIKLSAFEAKGNLSSLETAINCSFDNGMSLEELKEVFSHLYAYTGFPRSLNALGTLQKVVEKRENLAKCEKSYNCNEFNFSKDFNSLKVGTEIQTKLCGGKPFEYKFDSRTDYYLKAHLFGDIFANDILSHHDREIVTISAISILQGCESQLVSHVGGALNMGVKVDELRQIPSVLEENVGAKEAFRVRKAIATILKETFDEVEPEEFKIWPKGVPNTAYAEFFIGNSYLAPLDAEHGGPVNVTFEPRCRNNWHIHHDCTQVLVCVSGRGWYQEDGKDAIEMKPGSVIAISEGVKHWHGAAKDSWFQHLTYHTNLGKNVSNEWLEPVVDEVYDKLD